MVWTDNLPSWASVEMRKDRLGEDELWIAVESDLAYPKMLLAIEKAKPELAGIADEPTQEALGLARYIFTRYLKKLMYDSGGTPPMRLHIVDTNKNWALKKYKSTGTPIEKAGIYKKLGIYRIQTDEHISLD